MIKVNDEVICIEHFPDGTQKLSVESMSKALINSTISDWQKRNLY